jgi:hypothetical protein
LMFIYLSSKLKPQKLGVFSPRSRIVCLNR